jgi:protein-disulfide isomerase
MVTVGAIAAFVALVVLSLATADDHKIERVQEISAEGRSRGSATAPVTIIEFADYQCPFCKRFAETTEGKIEEQYVASGQVRLEFRNMAMIGPESARAAEAAECANDQGKFWEYHDLLYEEQRGENSGGFSDERLTRLAEDVGLDQGEFSACLDSGRHQQLVIDETEAGRGAGVESTPSFFINGELLTGARPFEDFQKVIDRKLAEAAEDAR